MTEPQRALPRAETPAPAKAKAPRKITNPYTIRKAEEKARNEPPMELESSCLPCYYGVHAQCRHRPNGPKFGRAPEGEPCLCEQRSHALAEWRCAARINSDGYGYNDRCDRLASTVMAIRPYMGGAGREKVEMPLCGVHAGAQRRVAANEEARRVEARRRNAEAARRKEAQQSAEEYRARLEALGVPHLKVEGGGRLSLPAEDLWMLVDRLAVMGELPWDPPSE